ncbi:MAG: hypothetical protein JWQ87_5285 [Candidatus Sulfotelmatobacter sp.]|nr:hypothetical protein [Candidatus Sulfotelmatobacter sp.]
MGCVLALLCFVQCSDPPRPIDNAAFLLQEANRLSWIGNWDGAGPLYTRAEAMFKAEGSQSKEIYARVGRIRAESANYSWEAVSQMLEDQLHQGVVQTDKDLKLWCLASLGYVDLDLDTAEAKKRWTEVLSIAKESGKLQWTARARGELGIIAFLDGNTGEATSQVGWALLSAFATGDVGEQVRLLSMLGNGYNEVHRFKEALGFFDRALVTAERTKDAGIPWMAYEGKAAALVGLGEPAKGSRLLEDVLAKARRLNRPMEQAEILVLLAHANATAGEMPLAQKQYEEAAKIAEQGLYYRPLARAMFELANMYREVGNLPAADKALTVGVHASRRLGDKYYLPRDLAVLAEVKAAENRNMEADALFAYAEDVMDSLFVAAHSRVAIRAMAQSLSDVYFKHFELVEKHHDIGKALGIVERLRNRTAAVDFSNGDTHAVRAGAASLETDIAQLQRALLKTEDEQQRSALLDKILQLERNLAYEENESAYGQDEKEIRAASLTNLRAALRADEQLVEYVLLGSRSYCIVVTRESASIIMLPEGRESIKDLIDSYTKELKSKRQGTDLASRLYSVLLAPVLRPQKRRLIVSPQGELKNLPFESLIGPSGQYLVQREVVTYIPSATTLWLQRTRTSPAAPKYSLLAVGDVDYRADRQHGLLSAIRRGIESLSQSKIVDLPETRDEVLTVAQAVGGDAKLLLGRDATESAFKTQPLRNFRIIHLAVHALADSQYPERTALVLGIDPAYSDDGLLQVREILHLHLNSELVTLSACETGVAGQAGVFSLQESFLMGGARTVVASLWNVEDHSTTVLMQHFYQHLAKGEGKANALTHAKQDFIQQFGPVSPFYWAGFVMAGEGVSGVSTRQSTR